MIAKTQIRKIWQIVLVLALSLSAIIFTMMLANASTPIAVDAGQWITECIDCSRYNYGGYLPLRHSICNDTRRGTCSDYDIP